MKSEIMQQLKQFGRALKKLWCKECHPIIQEKKFKVTFATFPLIGNTFEKNK